MRIGEDTIFGRIALALEGLVGKAEPDRMADALEAFATKVAAVQGAEYVEVAKDIGVGHADIVLTATELKASIVKLSGAGDAAFNLVLSAGVTKFYIIDNQSGREVTVKYSDTTGTKVASTERSWLWSNGTDVIPVILEDDYSEVTKDIGEGHADIVLTSSELKANTVILTGVGDGGFNLVLNAGVKRFYVVDNQSAQVATVKYSTSVGTAVAAGKRSWLWSNGTDVVPVVVA